METRPRRYMGLGYRLTHMPWWAYVLVILGVYLLGWVMRLTGVIPEH